MASLSVDISLNSSGTQATFTCYYSGLQVGYEGYRKIVYGVGDSWGERSIYGLSGSISVTISVSSGQVYGYTFILEYRNKEATDWGISTTAQGNYTAPKTPTISSFSVSQTAVGKSTARCRWSAYDLDDAYYEIEALDTGGRWWIKASGSTSGSGSDTISFDGFGIYTVRLTITNSSGLSTYSTTNVTMISVSKWDWYSSNGLASARQTSDAYAAITNNGLLTDFSYFVWNDMCAKVLALRDALGYSWDNTYADYNSTRMSSTDRNMTATRFNSLRYNLYARYSAVSYGDVIYGSYFTEITDRINSQIDNL